MRVSHSAGLDLALSRGSRRGAVGTLTNSSRDEFDPIRAKSSESAAVRIAPDEKGHRFHPTWMLKAGESTIGRKQSLGTRGPVIAGTRTPGAYQNISGLSRWFTKSARYERGDLETSRRDQPLARQ